VNSCVCGDIVNELLAQPTISTFEGVKMLVSLKARKVCDLLLS
jgi:hypothetical protein